MHLGSLLVWWNGYWEWDSAQIRAKVQLLRINLQILAAIVIHYNLSLALNGLIHNQVSIHSLVLGLCLSRHPVEAHSSSTSALLRPRFILLIPVSPKVSVHEPVEVPVVERLTVLERNRLLLLHLHRHIAPLLGLSLTH